MNSQSPMDEFLRLSERYEKIWLQIQEEIQDQQNITIVFLIGSQKSGKTTFYEYLQKTDQFNILEKRKSMYQSNESCLLNTFKINKSEPHLFLDFDSTLMEENHQNNLIFEELFLRLIEKYSIKIFLILDHPQVELYNRGFYLQQLIQKYLGRNKNSIQSLNIILNKYQDNLDIQNLIYNVQDEIKNLYETFCKEIVVLRKITTIEQQQEEFTDVKKDQILKSLFKSTPIKLQKEQFTLNYKIVSLLQQMIINIIDSIFQKIEDKIKKAELLKQEDFKNLKIKFQKIQDDSQKQDPRNLYLNSLEWSTFIQGEDKYNYDCLKKILQKFDKVILKSKILEEMNKKIQNTCLVFKQHVESYIKEDQHYNTTCQIGVRNEINLESLEKQHNKYKELSKMQRQELREIINEDYEKNPCEQIKKLKILIETLEDYDSKREDLSSQLEYLKNQKHKEDIKTIKNSQSSCQIF
ncbi:unnamed protein product [Paramecium octaurelia]|uniref:Uncharacterized protein n=1 Tax=Paramecium octaurelia TaxID=43137 RepID=A0A8S1V004_PAROT|nr:unnamed protein product [Paramecium octaurelia]